VHGVVYRTRGALRTSYGTAHEHPTPRQELEGHGSKHWHSHRSSHWFWHHWSRHWSSQRSSLRAASPAPHCRAARNPTLTPPPCTPLPIAHGCRSHTYTHTQVEVVVEGVALAKAASPLPAGPLPPLPLPLTPIHARTHTHAGTHTCMLQDAHTHAHTRCAAHARRADGGHGAGQDRRPERAHQAGLRGRGVCGVLAPGARRRGGWWVFAGRPVL